MTVAEAIRSGEATLARDGVPNARLDAEVLVAFVLGSTRDRLPARFRDTLAEGDLGRFRELLERRGGAKVPLQYLTGMQEFYSLAFRIRPGALIPRPETELLVDEAIAFARETAGPEAPPLRVADVGTGSGCIAVACAVNIPRMRGLAVDVSAEAVRLASENAARHGVLEPAGHVAVVQGDLLASVRPESLDAVLSNPPYVSARELDGLQVEVREHEPLEALVAGPTGLEIYERLIPQAARCLRRGGLLALELAAGRHDPVRGLLERGGWTDVAFREDFQGFERVLVGRRAGA